jgi:hypothetical protein
LFVEKETEKKVAKVEHVSKLGENPVELYGLGRG